MWLRSSARKEQIVLPMAQTGDGHLKTGMSLPFELVDTIASFLAYDYHFGTIASLNQTCRGAREVTLKTLYETLVIDDPKYGYAKALEKRESIISKGFHHVKSNDHAQCGKPSAKRSKTGFYQPCLEEMEKPLVRPVETLASMQLGLFLLGSHSENVLSGLLERVKQTYVDNVTSSSQIMPYDPRPPPASVILLTLALYEGAIGNVLVCEREQGPVFDAMVTPSVEREWYRRPEMRRFEDAHGGF
ncbi:hypothetical protein QFC19_000151 [Naganishia cerealis]|uniref:Uncharacterized protein n=1 Tax=Naganishia cerealis TaxID=610337 RepID=A0ACC2WS04_9TREE|nr:hypothetical protein QFC19_000151 [Naganishia cerealis]